MIEEQETPVETPVAAPAAPQAAPKKRKYACAVCYRESHEVEALDGLDWVKRHDGTRVCKRCRPEGQSGVDAAAAETAEVESLLKILHTVPATPAEKLKRLDAVELLKAKNVIPR